MSAPAGRVVNVQFYEIDQLPPALKKLASEQGITDTEGLVAVKTFVASPPKYKLEHIDAGPDGLKRYYQKLAREDGIELDQLAQRALSDE